MRRPLWTQSVAFAVVICALAAALARAEWVYVVKVIDGDTFVTDDGTKVRVKGVDTPETHHPTKPKESGGEAATLLAQSYLLGRLVWLEGKTQDPYGRRVARVKLSNGRWYDEIVRSYGYDKLSPRVDFPASSSRNPGASSFSRPTVPASGRASRDTASELTWVEGYYRKDGTWVSGHWRRKSSSSSSSPGPSLPSSAWKPPATSTGSADPGAGLVFVRGYYRKDGTYVRPHYRSKTRP